MKKRILPALLALCMVMALLPATVFAADCTGSADVENCEADTHTGACPKAACQLEGCTAAAAADHTNGSSKHTWACTCSDVNCANEAHTQGTCSGTATNQAADAKDTAKCDACAAPVACINATEEGKCKAETHEAGCIEKCDKQAECPATGAHKTGCVKGDKIAANTHTEDVEFTLTCACTDADGHGHENPCAAEIKVTESVTYTVTPAGDEATPNEVAEAKQSAIDEKKTALQGENPFCADCKADVVKACTGTVDCAESFHKKDCLSQCTMDGTCENTTGVPSAHKETYTVAWIRTGTADTRALGAGKITSSETTTNGSEPNIPYMAGVQTFVNGKVAIDEENEDEAYSGAEDTKWVSKSCRYKVTTVHCPKAGVADSTVLGATDEGETTDPTDPEVKAPEKAEDFSDLKGDEWYAEELTALMEKGVFKGSLDDGKYSFNATGNVTGAELVVLLSRVAGEDLVTTGTEWNKAATEWAAEAGYTEGVDITTTGKMTRQDVILVLWRAAGKPASEQSLEDFADAEGLEGDYLSAMKWAVEKGIIKGDGDTGALKADANITRAEMVSVLTRYSNAK